MLAVLLLVCLLTTVLSRVSASHDHDATPVMTSDDTSSLTVAPDIPTIQTLRQMIARIEKNVSFLKEFQNKYDPNVPAALQYNEGFWDIHLGTSSVFASRIDMCLHVLGNQLGKYFDDISCAAVAGMHFIGVFRRLEQPGSAAFKDLFLRSLPHIIVHSNPRPYSEAKKIVKNKCSCKRYCWNCGDPWVNNLPLITHIIRNGLEKSILTKGVSTAPSRQSSSGNSTTNTSIAARIYLPTPKRYTMFFDPEKDLHNINENINMTNALSTLPTVPNVAIHYRCSDNLFGGMGLLSFGTIVSRIPTNSKHIYIYSEYGSRLDGTPLAKVNHKVLVDLLAVITAALIKAGNLRAVVVVKRGSYELFAWYQMMQAGVLICSASTFCLYPGIANRNAVYFPSTGYIDSIDPTHFCRHNLSRSFHWIVDPHIYLNFTATSTIEQILVTLKSDL